MFKYLIGTFLMIGGALAWMYFVVGVSETYSEGAIPIYKPHSAHDPETSIEHVDISAVYFVPKDKTPVPEREWKPQTEAVLKELAEFHNIQLRGTSKINYEIYPRAVMGEFNSITYNTETTDNGNPRALIAIGEELERRFFGRANIAGTNDVRDSAQAPNSYSILLIVYEGVGAAGGIIHSSDLKTAEEIAHEIGVDKSDVFIVDIESADGFMLVNREYISGNADEGGLSITAHEFYHTLGVADKYGSSETAPASNDIMGAGRFRPLSSTYLDSAVVAEFGL
jgi:hypothetical protein